MEKFMLIFQGEMPAAPPSPEDMQISMDKWMAWINKLAQEGKYASGEPLLPGGKVLKGSHTNVTDGPFTEGKEVIGGYFIINAEDYAEAAALCDGYPDFGTGGTIIIRQVMKMDMPA